MGILALIVLVIVELFFFIWSVKTKNLHKQEKNVVRISEFAILSILILTGVFEWGFRYIGIALVLLIQTIIAVIAIIRRKEKKFRTSSLIRTFVLTVILYTGALLMAMICPQYTQPLSSGDYEVSTAKYTWVDKNRIDTYSDNNDNRTLTVEFWYPQDANTKYPLVVFSHGAFGFSGSNHSTFEELASNGYVVASIGHTYQAFYTMDTSGRLTTVDMDFLNTAMAVQNNDLGEDTFAVCQSWLDIRNADENFVLDTILELAGANDSDALFSMIDPAHIGLFGHSLGGAASAEVGRQRKDIDAVIVLDGTMLGEEVAPQNGKTILDESPYPIPLLNLYAEDHYTDAMSAAGENYANFYASKNAVNATEVMIKGAGHLNFTDLPLFSPLLAQMLGVGTVDSRYCIDTMNEIVLQYFNGYLKNMETPQFEKEY